MTKMAYPGDLEDRVVVPDENRLVLGTEIVNPNLAVSKTALAAFCEENGIRRLAVYGSALRDDFGPDSDIDLLVEFEPDRIPGLLGVAGMEITLSELFAGSKVDLRTAEDLSPYFRQEVLDMAEVQYMRARCNSPETCQN